MSRSKSAKGNVLSDSLLFIQSLENDIVDKVGTDQMKMYQDEFSNFLLHEEAMWKIKDTVKWWDKVEETLDSQENFSLEFSIDKADFPNTEWSHNSPPLDNNSASNTKQIFVEVPLCFDTDMETNEPVLQPFDEIFPRNYVQNTTKKDISIPFEEISESTFVPSEENHFSS